MKPSNIAAIVVGAIVLCGGSFYGGMQYGQKAVRSSFGAGANGGQRAFGGAAGLGQRGVAGGRMGGGGGFVAGDIASKDDKSMTIKLTNGGSKIVFFASSTTIGKMTEGSAADLAVGTSVVVSGATNADGSVTASTVQIRPNVVPSKADATPRDL